MRHVLGLLAVVGLLVGIVTGCGSGSSESTTAALTKAEFLKQGNATCKRGFTRVAKAIASATTEETKISKSQQQRRLFKAILPAYKEMIGDLRELAPPVEEEKKVNAILSAYEAEIEALEADPHRAFSGKLLFVHANDSAKSFGLSNCTI